MLQMKCLKLNAYTKTETEQSDKGVPGWVTAAGQFKKDQFITCNTIFILESFWPYEKW
jgi:hypothetical protein